MAASISQQQVPQLLEERSGLEADLSQFQSQQAQIVERVRAILLVQMDFEGEVSDRLARSVIERVYCRAGSDQTFVDDAQAFYAVQACIAATQKSIGAADARIKAIDDERREAENVEKRRAAIQLHDRNEAWAYLTKEMHALAHSPPNAPFPTGGPEYQDARDEFERLAQSPGSVQ